MKRKEIKQDLEAKIKEILKDGGYVLNSIEIRLRPKAKHKRY